MTILVIDPGKRNGWATFSASGIIAGRGFLFKDDLFTMLDKGYPFVKTVICENFRIFPGMGNRLLMNTMEAVRVIGAIEFAAIQRDWDLHLQEPNGMRQAVAWLGYKYSPKSHIPDHLSAHAHGVRWIEKQGIRSLKDLIKDKEDYEARDKS